MAGHGYRQLNHQQQRSYTRSPGQGRKLGPQDSHYVSQEFSAQSGRGNVSHEREIRIRSGHESAYDEDLDEYDRALLAESQPGVTRPGYGGHNVAIREGLAPTTFASRLDGTKGMGSGPNTPPPRFQRGGIGQYAYTPSDGTVKKSSPLRLDDSSPLYNMSQRRSAPSQANDTQTYSRKKSQINLPHAPPVIQGIPLIALEELPDRLRCLFSFPLFNAVQSRCFSTVYHSNDNLIVSAPTGSGKTVIFELAICRLLSTMRVEQYKVVYMAPTKSLCSERCADWKTRFAHLDLTCAELTGDTDHAHLRSVQSANVVVTTPEKWDSMTRQWKDHERLMRLVKLFLIDEVHILGDPRGAVLESVVSRMKSVGSQVRFIALSATVPNSQDVATWLGKDQDNQDLPAVREVFGEKFRPVILQKHVIGVSYAGNDFGFDSACDPKLAEIISKYGKMKPVMIFCMTRKSASSTAKLLSNVWASKGHQHRLWKPPNKRIKASDPELTETLSCGVAFHHAGIDVSDRNAIEKGYLDGHISVICCTSTLAVGVNLPCHLVIIKNTLGYHTDGLKEYSDLETMQMLGRAGRPQFDDSAVAVILTKSEKVKRYEQLISETQMLESCLHLNLIDHLMAEISLGTISDLHSAKRWLAGTFLHVRLRNNPAYYKNSIDGVEDDLDGRTEAICRRDIDLLSDSGLAIWEDRLQATELGAIMARYYVNFQTMQNFLTLGSRPRISDILSVLVQAEEFRDVRFKANEKKLLKEMNSNSGLRFPIKVDLALAAHKRSILIQSELGGIDFPMNESFSKFKRGLQQETQIILSNMHRLVRCVVDIQIHEKDAIGARNALELARSFDARAWDTSPLQMKQIKNIGVVTVRKFAANGIQNLEDLEATDPQRIEVLLSKNPPFGERLLSSVREFPSLRVSMKLVGKDMPKGHPVNLRVKVEAGFMNEKPPLFFARQPIFVCLLVERSDGMLLDFRRISAKKLDNSEDMLVHCAVTHQSQYLTCYVMCDAIAGTLRYAMLKPQLPEHLFPKDLARAPERSNSSKSRSLPQGDDEEDDFGLDDIDDADLMAFAPHDDFMDIDRLSSHNGESKAKISSQRKNPTASESQWTADKLENGKWACNHKCKDKNSCKHLCCREGLDKMPKPPKTLDAENAPIAQNNLNSGRKSNNESHPKNKKKPDQGSKKLQPGQKTLENLHRKLVNTPHVPIVKAKGSLSGLNKTSAPKLSFENNNSSGSKFTAANSNSDAFSDGFPSPSTLLALEGPFKESVGGKPLTTKTDHVDTLEEFDLSQMDVYEEDLDEAMLAFYHANDTTKKGHTALPPLDAQNLDRTGGSVSSAGHDTHKNPSSVLKPPTGDSPTSASPPAASYAVESSLHSKRPRSTSPIPDSTLIIPGTKRQKPSSIEPNAQEPSTWPHGAMTQVDNTSSAAMHDQSSNLLTSSGLDSVIPEVITAPNPTPLEPKASVIKPGQPAWVYEFDPSFIAEYQDLVNFI